MTDEEVLAEVELTHVGNVISRMLALYPTLPRVDIENCVRTIHQRFNGCRVRDFVPLLVEKSAKIYLAAKTQPNVVIPAGTTQQMQAQRVNVREVTGQSSADQIAAAKGLLDAGAINEDEFLALKANLWRNY
ncbi:SHOCT domain-containing protein [Rhodococcus globerulus]|uniref:SHOCT domain-containing protein n=1 Tax=Rhodococcus globerulus TaxID=33008 RepID=A0ABU4C405_RHOGO|nr:SHOCT domain-containing protein [Rhodococcus globerulus]MDV6270953.1 SHOCT domain-containing protein [Rhodococcus globerulus]